MSTRGCVGRLTSKPGEPLKWKGRYIHFDAYPSGLGARLYELRNGHFKGDTKAMLKVLLDDHKAGWSTIDGDFNNEPGYMEPDYCSEKDPEKQKVLREKYFSIPKCYCHGSRSDKAYSVNEKNASGSGCEYGYLFTSDGNIMVVISCDSCDRNAKWKVVGQVDLNEVAPDWEKLPLIQVAVLKKQFDAEVEEQKKIDVKVLEVKKLEEKGKEEFKNSDLYEIIG